MSCNTKCNTKFPKMIPPRLTTGAYVCPNFPEIRTQDEIMTYRIIYSPECNFKANRSSNSFKLRTVKQCRPSLSSNCTIGIDLQLLVFLEAGDSILCIITQIPIFV